MKRKLPIGIQTFREIREDGCYYVDKTPYIKSLLEGGKHYFLSRPRRFGKSLFVDTLKELFEGNEQLFEGLAIHREWDWSACSPVVRLDFSSGSFASADDLHAEVTDQLDVLAAQAAIELGGRTAAIRFRRLIRELHERTGQRVVVLVDEYDKPILDSLDTPDLAAANRDFLRALYGTVKSSDADVQFAFFTGVSKFSKVSLFSDLNQLIDITLTPRYAAACGYTDEDIDSVFAAELPGLDRDAIRDWYNGYGWRGPERVYNPFDILLLFFHREFRGYWFETATPSFLVRTLARSGLRSVDLEGLRGTMALLSSFDIDDIEPEALLFQTGYLTVVDEELSGGEPVFRLGYPNREVRQSLNEHLLRTMTPATSRRLVDGAHLRAMLADGDLEALEASLRALFASIPHDWYRRNDIARYEGYYASVCYSHFAAAGVDVTVEDATNHGRVDISVQIADRVYLMEIKVVESVSVGAAMAQLQARRYAEKYLRPGLSVWLVALEFSRETRNIVAFDTEAM